MNTPSKTLYFQPTKIYQNDNNPYPIYRGQFITHNEEIAVHASHLTELSDGKIITAWFGGSREGARDISIYTSIFDPELKRWGLPRKTITRAMTQNAYKFYIKKLGNPVIFKHQNGQLWLFYVSTTIGGWATSSINLIISTDQGKTWGRSKRLITSPFFNLSTLVRNTPFFLNNSTNLILPAYHEMLNKFGELLLIDLQGNVRNKVRLSKGRSFIQPAIVPYSKTAAIGFMRASGSSQKKIYSFETNKGPLLWQKPQPTELPNPNAAITALRTGENELLIVFNNESSSRSNLALASYLIKEKKIEIIHTFENQEKKEFSYPSLIQTSDGLFHLVYTWNRTQIKHIMFNKPWLDSL